MLTLGFTWPKSRISCWKALEELALEPVPAQYDFDVDFKEPAAMWNDIGLTIESIVQRRRYIKDNKHHQNIRNILGTNQMQITTQRDVWRNGAWSKTVGRQVKVELLMSPYDMTNFAREMSALVKKYDRNKVRRGWAPKTPPEIAQRYLNKYKIYTP
jgi:hypothetical protein